jgi:hypothetical protein
MNQLGTRAALAGSGSVLTLIGAALLATPVPFLAMNGVNVEPDPSLMSELAAPGGVLLITGLFMVAGAAWRALFQLALGMGAVVYGAYGLGRLVAVALHGAPSQSLLTATAIELGVAIVLAALWFKAPARKGGR